MKKEGKEKEDKEVVEEEDEGMRYCFDRTSNKSRQNFEGREGLAVKRFEGLIQEGGSLELHKHLILFSVCYLLRPYIMYKS